MPDHSQLGRLTFARVGTLAGQAGAAGCVESALYIHALKNGGLRYTG